MPGVYTDGSFDIAGTLVGVAERDALLPRDDVAAGDVLIGVASSGPHTNGYSLLRKLFAWIPMDVTPAGFDRPLGDTLLEPHRNYLPVLEAAVATGAVKALAHITGGGLPENVPRVLPSDVDAVIELGSWPVPPLFRLVRELATALDDHELHRTLQHGHRHGRRVLARRRRAGAVSDRRGDVGDRRARRSRRRRPAGTPRGYRRPHDIDEAHTQPDRRKRDTDQDVGRPEKARTGDQTPACRRGALTGHGRRAQRRWADGAGSPARRAGAVHGRSCPVNR